MINSIKEITKCVELMDKQLRNDLFVKNGFKQKVIAEKAGIPNVTFNAMMNGKRTMYAEDFKAICIALNVSPEIFIDLNKGE